MARFEPRMPGDRYPGKLFYEKSSGKRSRGWPKKRWEKDIEEDLKSLRNHGRNRQAVDRDQWKDAVEQARILFGL